MGTALVEHVERAYPSEGCGFLIGNEAAGFRTVHAVPPVANRTSHEPSTHFLIPPDEILRVDRLLRPGQRILGFYHSHPDGGREPSELDRERAWPGYTYVVVALERGRAPRLGAWRLRPDRSGFDEETITEA